MMFQCEECESWRLLYSQKKLTVCERTELEKALSDYVYTCGASLQEMELTGKLNEVYVQDVKILSKSYTILQSTCSSMHV